MSDRWIRFDQGTDDGITKSLSLLSLTAEECVSSLPRYDLTAEIINRAEFVFYSLAGRPVAVRWSPDNDPQHDRRFEGIVVDVQDNDEESVPSVRLEVRPWLWLLTQNVQCRIYQDATVLDIIEDLIRNELTSKISSGNYRYDVSGIKGDYAERNYCVQYNESDFDFLARILEDEGIYYYYGPDGVLYFADDSLTSPTWDKFVPDNGQSPTNDIPAPAFNTAAGPIRRWRRSQRFRTSKHEVCDVHGQAPAEAYVGAQGWTTQLLLDETSIELPRISKLITREASAGFANQIDIVSKSGSAEVSDFAPVGQKVRELADRVAKRRAEEKGCAAYRIEGNGDYPFFWPGVSFQPAENLDKGISGSFLLLEVRHQIATSSVRSNDPAGARTYSNSFVCIPRNVVYRPSRTTPKSKIVGTQTALVVGLTEDSPVCADVLGRILVEFYWTKPPASESARLKIHDPQQCSAWVRWMQPWAGTAFGMQTIPRVGHEVVIAFQDGDPDQPIAIGSVSNGRNHPAFPPKEQPNVSGIKTNSIGRDGSSFNGLRFDDSPDKEVTQFRGQRELLVDAKQNVALSAGNSLIGLAARQVTIVGEQSNIVGLGGQDGSESNHWNNELTAAFPDGWTPVVQPVEPATCTRFNAAFGYDIDMSAEFTLRCTGARHDISGAALGELADFGDVLGAIATKVAAAAALAAAMNTFLRSIFQGLGRLDLNDGPGTSIVGGLSLELYRGGRYEFVGVDEWPLFPPASLVIQLGWPMYGAVASMVPSFLVEESPAKAAENAELCTDIARGISFIVMNCERVLAGLTAGKRLATSGVQVASVVQTNAAAGIFSFRHALDAARKLAHAATKIAGDLDDGNSFQEILGGHYLHAGKDVGIQSETGISFESPSVIAKSDEISLVAGGSQLVLGNTLSPLKLSSDLFTLKHSPALGLELSISPLGSITINPLGVIKIKGLKIDLEAATIGLTAGPNSITLDPAGISSKGLEISNQALGSISNACPKQSHTPM